MSTTFSLLKEIKMNAIKLKLFYMLDGEHRELISLDNACLRLDIGKRALQYDIQKNKTPTVIKIGNVGYFDLAEFNTYKQNRKVKHEHNGTNETVV